MISGSFRRIIVCCPHSVTGGPELLHQLVHELRQLGLDAYIYYYPFDEQYARPAPYRRYDAPPTPWIDEDDSLFVLPEVATKFALRIKKGRVVIWWLSVASYYATAKSRPEHSLSAALKPIAKAAFLLGFLRRHVHVTQSAYARKHLRHYGIHASMLSDYLNREYLTLALTNSQRRRDDVILYNPKKGARVVEKLTAYCPELRFVPIRDMSRDEVIQIMSRAKLYIDFGHHPGKDRMPREAAIAGCCIVTGLQGAARNDTDIPIPLRYKIDERDGGFAEKFRKLALDILESYSERTTDFDAYRESILAEPAQFRADVERVFGSCRNSHRDSVVAQESSLTKTDLSDIS